MWGCSFACTEADACAREGGENYFLSLIKSVGHNKVERGQSLFGSSSLICIVRLCLCLFLRLYLCLCLSLSLSLSLSLPGSLCLSLSPPFMFLSGSVSLSLSLSLSLPPFSLYLSLSVSLPVSFCLRVLALRSCMRLHAGERRLLLPVDCLLNKLQ